MQSILYILCIAGIVCTLCSPGPYCALERQICGRSGHWDSISSRIAWCRRIAPHRVCVSAPAALLTIEDSPHIIADYTGSILWTPHTQACDNSMAGTGSTDPLNGPGHCLSCGGITAENPLSCHSEGSIRICAISLKYVPLCFVCIGECARSLAVWACWTC